MTRHILAILFLVLLTIPCAAWADPGSYYLEDLTWPEVKARMEKGTDTIIIPSGGTEQNGPGIAIGKHNWIVRYTSGEIARELGNALAAPVIAYVPEGNITPPEGHMKFPGTISLRDEGYALILEDAARSFRQEGFTYICFIGDHGGDQAMQKQVADKLNAEWKGRGVTVIDVSDYYANNGEDAWVKLHYPDIATPDAHAGFLDAAEIMAAHGKDSVRPALMKHYTENDFAATGAKGDASKATVTYGKALLALKIKAAVEQIRKNKKQP